MTMFDAGSLHAAVVQALADAAIPEGDTHALALVATTDGRVQAVISTRFGGAWQIDLVAAVQKGHPIEGGVQVKASWK
jgi:hypothetical protein